MTLAERHDFIMDLLQQQGSVSVAALAERLKVSEVTIRKDLTLLEEKKMLYRAHGSAILINPYINDRPVNDYYIHTSGQTGVKTLPERLTSEDYGIAVAKGNTELVGKINAALKKLKENGEYDKIFAKWFGTQK